MKTKAWHSWIDSEGKPLLNVPFEREYIYQGNNGKFIERWTFNSNTDGTEQFIFKPSTNLKKSRMEQVVEDFLLPNLTVRTPRIIAYSESNDPDCYWIILEDLGVLNHTLNNELIMNGTRAAAEWHQISAAEISLPYGGHSPLIGEVLEQIKISTKTWESILIDAGYSAQRIEMLKQLVLEEEGTLFTVNVLSHGDYYPLNLALRGEELVIIDWEYVQINSVYWDLYNLLDITSPRYRRPAQTRQVRKEALNAYLEERQKQPTFENLPKDDFIEGYMRYAIYYSLWILTLVEQDIINGRFDEKNLRSQRDETLNVIFQCSSHWIHPLVSVITPTFNRPEILSEMLEGLHRQTYKDIECIIVNDGGTSVEWVVDLYPELDIKVINQENMKHPRARNNGVASANGKFILLCDDDDILLPTHTESMLEAMKDYQLVYSDAEIVEFIEHTNGRTPERRQLFAYLMDLEAMREFSTFIPSGCMYHKSIHEEIGYFDEEVYHYWDWDFFLRVSAIFKVNRVPIASVLYAFSSQAGTNLSANTDSMRPFLDKLSKKHNLGELPTKNFFTLLEEERVQKRFAESKIIWDGEPIVSRYSIF
ncbi:glycosyltransferase [Paenibacillus psychroresistens]|uniref:Glycosyltransferase n=1 Tax=Paenibacillus psychroresistens TaxID=1778678 RepID=A0A6B8RKL3_9BACL|nr:glycosyltransferase [Paenibacillus psychroresistens]QGQ96093.1 glycosyltransferase [Paenibacillus psychroresistens]